MLQSDVLFQFMLRYALYILLMIVYSVYGECVLDALQGDIDFLIHDAY